MIWDGKMVDLEMDFLLYDIIKKINYFNIIILKRGFQTIQLSLLSYLVSRPKPGGPDRR